MSSAPRGTSTSTVEVTQVSPHGVWLLLRGEELFMPFEDFPWFQGASADALARIEEPTPGHLYWPDLDVDLGLEIIRHPERFPLKSRVR
jgi:hypothetical protein